MKYAIPEISWHNRDPVLSVDFQPNSSAGEPLRLATGGTDTHVLIWYISTTETGSVNLEVAADLTRHQKAVNVVRWSPNGQLLASGDDESIIFVWKQKTEEPAPAAEGEEQYKETWVIHKTLRGHMEDVLDISWSADSLHLASGSVDNKLLLWDITRGRHTSILADHKGFVQGVAWDPKGQLVATASTDRTFRIFDIASKKVVSRSSKATLPFPSGHPLHGTSVRLYHDDTLQTYYRRLSFSPDGLLVAVPGGRIEPDQGKLDTKPVNAVYIYTRFSLKVPACVLPCGDPALVTRWCPVPLAPRPGPPPRVPLPHRMVLAVGTKRSILLYDTQQKTPIAMVFNIHYTRLTDLTWSADGSKLVASSTDGFCSIISFAPAELGEPAPSPAVDIPAADVPEPMEVQTEEAPAEQQQKQSEKTAPSPKQNKSPKPETKSKAEPKSTTPKIDSYMKFKTPTEKSPNKTKKSNTNTKDKTPVKLDLLMESAMPSWSDNSNSDVIKPVNEIKEVKPMEIVEIEDSEDFKLVYEETCGSPKETSGEPKDAKMNSTDNVSENKEKNTETDNKMEDTQDFKLIYEESCDTSAKPEEVNTNVSDNFPEDLKKGVDKPADTQPKDTKKKSPEINSDVKGTPERKRVALTPVGTPTSSKFLEQAKVTDLKESAAKPALSPKAPRRVSFVTLSSPKNKKKC